MILTRKSHNCAGTAFVQGDTAGGSKMIEQTLHDLFLYFLNPHTLTFYVGRRYFFINPLRGRYSIDNTKL